MIVDENGLCTLHEEAYSYHSNGREKRKTNAARIRNMTDEELAEWIAGYALGLTGASLEMSTHAWFDWLKQEAS